MNEIEKYWEAVHKFQIDPLNNPQPEDPNPGSIFQYKTTNVLDKAHDSYELKSQCEFKNVSYGKSQVVREEPKGRPFLSLGMEKLNTNSSPTPDIMVPSTDFVRDHPDWALSLCRGVVPEGWSDDYPKLITNSPLLTCKDDGVEALNRRGSVSDKLPGARQGQTYSESGPEQIICTTAERDMLLAAGKWLELHGVEIKMMNAAISKTYNIIFKGHVFVSDVYYSCYVWAAKQAGWKFK